MPFNDDVDRFFLHQHVLLPFSLQSPTSYVALFPCNECAKLIIQAGINNIVFISDKVGVDCMLL